MLAWRDTWNGSDANFDSFYGWSPTGLLQSTEFAAKTPLSDTAFVDQPYANMLGRPADPAGQAYWTNDLANGMSRGAVAAGLALSTEAVDNDGAKLAHGVFISK